MNSTDGTASQQAISAEPNPADQVVLLVTGVTGFLGKVVVEELFRRQAEGSLHFDRLMVLIRSARGKLPSERFQDKVVGSPCFSRLPAEWYQNIEVVAGDLMEASCGITPESLALLTRQVTHIIHCAGCVSFDSPLNVLLAENVTASVNILQLAQSCQALRRLILTSTAYVTPHTKEPIWEQLVDLPRPAQQILDDLHEGRKDPDQVLAETGHPNYYTLAKCLAEHVVAQKMGDTPLSIIRPSIISASLQYPFPGWIDSFAAVAGPVSAFALGGLRVLHGNPSTTLDVVPVDYVARCIIDETLFPSIQGSFDLKKLNENAKIVHCVSTIRNGLSTWNLAFETVGYFEKPENVVLYKPRGYYVGVDDRWFYFYEFFYQYLPIKFAELSALMVLDWDGAAKARKTLTRLGQIDTHFRYFVEHTYDYRCAAPVLGEDFDKMEYFSIVLQGVKQHLLVPLVTRMRAKARKTKVLESRNEEGPGAVL